MNNAVIQVGADDRAIQSALLKLLLLTGFRAKPVVPNVFTAGTNTKDGGFAYNWFFTELEEASNNIILYCFTQPENSLENIIRLALACKLNNDHNGHYKIHIMLPGVPEAWRDNNFDILFWDYDILAFSNYVIMGLNAAPAHPVNPLPPSADKLYLKCFNTILHGMKSPEYFYKYDDAEHISMMRIIIKHCTMLNIECFKELCQMTIDIFNDEDVEISDRVVTLAKKWQTFYYSTNPSEKIDFEKQFIK